MRCFKDLKINEIYRTERSYVIHEKIIEKTGGLSGYNETQIGYLASALEHIKNDDFILR